MRTELEVIHKRGKIYIQDVKGASLIQGPYASDEDAKAAIVRLNETEEQLRRTINGK